jgi:hypothetical protein
MRERAGMSLENTRRPLILAGFKRITARSLVLSLACGAHPRVENG